MTVDRQTELDRDWDFPTPADADASLPAVPTQREPALPAAETQPDADILDARGLTQAQDRPTSGQQSGATLFGIAIPPHAAHAVAGSIQQIAANGVGELQAAGVRPAIAQAASDWFRQAATAPPPSETTRHGYRIDLGQLSAADRPFASQFLNRMAQVSASQSEVTTMLVWYGRLLARLKKAAPKHTPAPETQLSDADAAAIDGRDRANAEIELKAKWGESFYQNIATINAYLDAMPRAERERLEAKTLAHGGLALNDPEILSQLLFEAHTKTGPHADLLREIEQIEEIMRTDRRRYQRDEAMQARLRALYELRDG